MPPKRRTAAPATSRPSRVTKTRAGETIHQAIGGRAHQTALVSTSPDSGAVVPNPSVLRATLEALQPQLAGIEDRFQALENSITENQTEVRSVLSDTFNQIMDRLDGMEPQPPNAPGPVTTIPGPTHAQGTNPLGDPHNVLSRFYWVETSVVQSISDGDFDIHDLPKLHREEEQRMRHSKKVTEGLHFPADGGKPELVTGRTKMHLAFKDLATFLSAWMVYVSIRSSFVPERASPLAYWTERVVFYAQSGFQWHVVLNYAIPYFTAHQKSPADTWYSVNTHLELATNHFTVARKGSLQENSSGQSRTSGKRSPLPIQDQTCANRLGFGCNYKERFGDPCPRKHRSSVCLNVSHKATECPSKSST